MNERWGALPETLGRFGSDRALTSCIVLGVVQAANTSRAGLLAAKADAIHVDAANSGRFTQLQMSPPSSSNSVMEAAHRMQGRIRDQPSVEWCLCMLARPQL